MILGTTHWNGCGNTGEKKHAKCPKVDFLGSWKGRRNRIRCLHCNDVIEATHQHDFKSCKCKKVSIDGGALGHWRRLFPSVPASDHFVEVP